MVLQAAMISSRSYNKNRRGKISEEKGRRRVDVDLLRCRRLNSVPVSLQTWCFLRQSSKNSPFKNQPSTPCQGRLQLFLYVFLKLGRQESKSPWTSMAQNSRWRLDWASIMPRSNPACLLGPSGISCCCCFRETSSKRGHSGHVSSFVSGVPSVRCYAQSKRGCSDRMSLLCALAKLMRHCAWSECGCSV